MNSNIGFNTKQNLYYKSLNDGGSSQDYLPENALMQELPPKDELLVEFARERSIRRTVRVLQAKRSRLKKELNQLLIHLSLLVPGSKEYGNLRESSSEINLRGGRPSRPVMG